MAEAPRGRHGAGAVTTDRKVRRAGRSRRAASPEQSARTVTPGHGGLPEAIAAAWGVRERPHKGPKPALSLPRIVDAAVRVGRRRGARRGLDGPGRPPSSAPRRCRCTGTCRPRRNCSPDGGRRLGRSSASPGGGEDWRAGLSRWAWAMRAGARRHPWVVRIPLNGLPIMPHEVAWFEHALACLHETGLAEAQKASVIMLLGGYVRNQATTDADIEAAIRASGQSPARVDGLLPPDAGQPDRSAAVPRARRVPRRRGLRRRRRPGRRVHLRPGPHP